MVKTQTAALFGLGVALVSLGAHAACPTGKQISRDTRGHCCWPGQAWSSIRNECVGTPKCPTGLNARGESCEPIQCPDGKTISKDTAGQCCWPNQVWSEEKSHCVGVPKCPDGYEARKQHCIQKTSSNAPGPTDPTTPIAAKKDASSPGEANTVPLQFVSETDDGQFTVTTFGTSKEQACAVPCTLMLTPGPTRIRVKSVNDSDGFEREILVPSAPAVVRLRTATTGRLIYGIVAGGVGLPLVGLGVAGIGNRNSLSAGIVLTSLAGLFAISGGIVALTYKGDAATVVPIFMHRSSARTNRIRFVGIGAWPSVWAGRADGFQAFATFEVW